MLVTTTLDINGYEVAEYKGLVRGIVVRSPTITQGFLGGLKNIVGGQIGGVQAAGRSHKLLYGSRVAL